MAVGGYYFDASGLDELARELAATAGGIRDLSKIYRQIGKKGALYVKTHWPIYPGSSKDGAGHQNGALADGTTGGGGKSAWVRTTDGGAGHLIVQEFGGTSYWYRGGSGVFRKLNRAHEAVGSLSGGRIGTSKYAMKGHVVYTKPRRPKGYVLWNVAWRLRSQIAADLTNGICEISEKHGLHMDVADRSLDIEQKSWNRAV